jgi:ABC-type Fe3+-siderophore transport system permease subunit
MLLPWLAGQVIGTDGAQLLIYLVFGALIMNVLAFAAMLNFRPKSLPNKTLTD